MKCPLIEIIPPQVINFICKLKKQACKFLTDYYNEHYDEHCSSDEDLFIDEYIRNK